MNNTLLFMEIACFKEMSNLCQIPAKANGLLYDSFKDER
jgi:hypothetical protein